MGTFTDKQNSTLTIRDYPLAAWIIGLFLLGWAVFAGLGGNGDWVVPLISGTGGLLCLVLASTLVVQADRMCGTLTIRRTSLLRRYVREIPISSIAAIQLESADSSGDSSGTYRIVAITNDNETIPFRTTYSSGTLGKEAKARKLREFLGVSGADMSLSGKFQQASSMAQQVFQQSQESMSGPDAEEHVTEGVHWKVQTVAFGGKAITRWLSPDQQCTNGFIFLAQKVAGHAVVSGGLLAGLSKFAYREIIGLYGFKSEETPGLETAEQLASLDPQLDLHFAVFTSNPGAAWQYLNPWSIAPLVDWATRYPLELVQSTNQLFGQLVVMICPTGTYVANMGTMIPEAVQELVDLGVALVKGK